ncbi:hypothetical protein BC831DRAFT_446333 [Entophlyctis helioformis]|nr:hypothetical protein BC831DRAFT_446333 [Entophlyctis helioformis]
MDDFDDFDDILALSSDSDDGGKGKGRPRNRTKSSKSDKSSKSSKSVASAKNGEASGVAGSGSGSGAFLASRSSGVAGDAFASTTPKAESSAAAPSVPSWLSSGTAAAEKGAGGTSAFPSAAAPLPQFSGVQQKSAAKDMDDMDSALFGKATTSSGSTGLSDGIAFGAAPVDAKPTPASLSSQQHSTSSSPFPWESPERGMSAAGKSSASILDGDSLLSAAMDRGRGRRQQTQTSAGQGRSDQKKPAAEEEGTDDDLFDMLGLGDAKAKRKDKDIVAPSFLARDRASTVTGAGSGSEPGSGYQPTLSTFGIGSKPTGSTGASPSSAAFVPSGMPDQPTRQRQTSLGATASASGALRVGGDSPISSAHTTFIQNATAKTSVDPPAPGFLAGSAPLRSQHSPVNLPAGNSRGSAFKADDDGLPSFLQNSSGNASGRPRGRGSIAAPASTGRSMAPDPMDLIAGLMGGAFGGASSASAAPASRASNANASTAAQDPPISLPCRFLHVPLSTRSKPWLTVYVGSTLAVLNAKPRVSAADTAAASAKEPKPAETTAMPSISSQVERAPDSTAAAHTARQTEETRQTSADQPASGISKSESLSSIAMLSDTDDESEPAESPAVAEKASIKSGASGGRSSGRSKQQQDGEMQIKLDEMQKKLDDAQLEIARLSNAVREAETKALQDKVEREVEHAKALTDVRNEHETVITRLKEQHQSDMDALEQDINAKAERMFKLQLSEVQVQHAKELGDLKQLHLEEIQQTISRTDNARQIQELTGRMENNTKAMDSLQSKLEADHVLSLQHREDAVTQRESQMAQLQEQLARDKLAAEAERLKAQSMMERMESVLMETKRKQEEELESIYRDRARLSEQIQHVQQERDTASTKLQQERSQFAVEREAWEADRRRIISQVTEERKQLSIERAELASLERMNRQLREELALTKLREDDRHAADKQVLERDIQALHARFAELHRREAELRAEKLQVDGLRMKLEIQESVFERERESTEQRVRQAAFLYGEAAREGHQAKAKQSEAEAIQRQLEMSRLEYEGHKARLQNERKQFVAERVALAEMRNQALKRQQIKTGLAGGATPAAHYLEDARDVDGSSHQHALANVEAAASIPFGSFSSRGGVHPNANTAADDLVLDVRKRSRAGHGGMVYAPEMYGQPGPSPWTDLSKLADHRMLGQQSVQSTKSSKALGQSHDHGNTKESSVERALVRRLNDYVVSWHRNRK